MWPKYRWLVGTVLYGSAALVGLARVYQSQHWASDVVIGAGIGTFTGLKVVRYAHAHPDNFLDRVILNTHVTPAPGGGTTITITPAGVSPATITVALGSQVTFVNNDIQNHDMLSDPHPEHTDCPELNSVGFMTPGQSRQSGNLNTARTCGYHDHELFGDPKWQGKIIIQ